MRLAKFSKSPADKLKYTIDYTNWLDTGETLLTAVSAVSPTTASTLSLSGLAVDGTGKLVSFIASNGDVGTQYKVIITVTTSGGQTTDDTVLFNVVAE